MIRIIKNMSLEKQRLEHQISKLVLNDNGCSVHYTLKSDINGLLMTVSTYNPNHDTSFLLWEGQTNKSTTQLENELHLLQQLLNYLKNEIPPKDLLHYKIKWIKVGNPKLIESFFVGRTAKEVLDKFFHDKNNHDYRRP